jgi:hypothetical protein
LILKNLGDIRTGQGAILFGFDRCALRRSVLGTGAPGAHFGWRHVQLAVEKANLIRVLPGGAILRIALEAYLQSRPGRTGMKFWQDELLRVR